MVARSGGLRRGDDALAQCLAAGWSYADAAEMAGVSERTVSRRMGDKGFQALVRLERGRYVDAVRDRLSAGAFKAVAQLEWNLHSCYPQVEVSAARAILEYGLKYRAESRDSQRVERFVTETRIVAVEQRTESEAGSVLPTPTPSP